MDGSSPLKNDAKIQRSLEPFLPQVALSNACMQVLRENSSIFKNVWCFRFWSNFWIPPWNSQKSRHFLVPLTPWTKSPVGKIQDDKFMGRLRGIPYHRTNSHIPYRWFGGAFLRVDDFSFCFAWPKMGYTPKKLTVRPWKCGFSKRKLVFQPSIFRCYVSFLEGSTVLLRNLHCIFFSLDARGRVKQLAPESSGESSRSAFPTLAWRFYFSNDGRWKGMSV